MSHRILPRGAKHPCPHQAERIGHFLFIELTLDSVIVCVEMKRSASFTVNVPSAKKAKSKTKRKTFVAKNLGSGPELKCFDVYNSGTGVSSSGAVEHLTPIAASSSVNGRTGRLISYKSILARGWIVAADATNWFRLIMYYDSEPNGTNATVSDVISDLGGNYGTFTPINLNQTGRFKILKDKQFNVGSPGAGNSVGIPVQVPFKWYSRLDGLKGRFLADAAAVPQMGSICFLYISDSGAISHPSIYHSTRVRYTDN